MSAWIAQHRKLIVAIFGAALTVAVQAGLTSNPYVSAIVLIATAAGVYQAPNTDPVTAPAAPTLPSTPGGGGTRPVRVIKPEPVAERIAGHGTGQPGAAKYAGTEGGPVTGVRS